MSKLNKRGRPRHNCLLMRFWRRFGVWPIVALVVIGAITAASFAIINKSRVPEMADITRITVDELKAKMDSGVNIIIVDTRSQEQYDELHIAGAIFITYSQVAEHKDMLKKYDEIITYCT